jgi:hypothetical protein
VDRASVSTHDTGGLHKAARERVDLPRGEHARCAHVAEQAHICRLQLGQKHSFKEYSGALFLPRNVVLEAHGRVMVDEVSWCKVR